MNINLMLRGQLEAPSEQVRMSFNGNRVQATRGCSQGLSATMCDLDVTALAADVGPQQGAGARAGCTFARSSSFDCLYMCKGQGAND